MKILGSFKQKIWFSLSIMICGYFISMVFGFVYGRRTESRLYNVSEYLFPAVRQSQTALSLFNEGMKHYEDAVILSDTSFAEDAREKLENAQNALQEIINLEGFQSQKTDAISEILTSLTDFSTSAYTVYSAMSSDLDAFGDQTNVEGETLGEKASVLAQQSQDLRDQLNTTTLTLTKDLRAELLSISDSTQRQRYINTIIFLVVLSSTTILVSIMITRSVITPINQAISFSNAIAKGDFTVRIHIKQRDELGKLIAELGDMAKNLNSLLGQVQQTGIKVSSTVTELSATAKQQEVTITNQVQSTHNVLKAVEEISHVAINLVETMQQVAAMSQETAEFASNGQADLARMKDAMRRMEDASKSISSRLEAINEKAGNITNVVTTITKVADQTNLLSLNAAIEAEKAGEYGRGFTVVAREIRRLADQTAVATLDIEQMVREMQTAVVSGVMEMDKFIAEVRHNVEDVEKLGTQLSRIIEQVQALSPRFEEVNIAMGQQSDHAKNINTAMTELSEEMQRTSESLGESFFAIEQLNDVAVNLREEVSRFKVH